MRFLSLPLLLLFSLGIVCANRIDYTRLVNPFIGTDYTGNTYPGAQVPFGMVQLSPDNGLPGWDRIAGYFYPDSTIAGFSHTHLSGTGAGDLYDVSFMPITLPVRNAPDPLGVHSRFSHQREMATAGYYQVYLEDYDISVELTATERCGIQRYTFPEEKKPIVLLNLGKAMNWDATTGTFIRIVDSCTVEGYRFSDGWARGQKVYFRTRFSQPFLSVHMDSIQMGKDRPAVLGTVRFEFAPRPSCPLLVATALSSTGLSGAERNLNAEAPHDDFERYRADARNGWNSLLGRIEVKGGTQDERVCFYTALYHALLAPTVFCDVDGAYLGPDGNIHTTDGWINYSTFSLWDTFRAAHPLYTILVPERVDDMVQSMLAFQQQHGRLPVWNLWGSETDMMIGYHAVPVIVDAYLKGFRGFDARKALDACVATACFDDYRGIGFYRSNGYVPYDVADQYNADDWSLSRTMEYAYDDACIARLAEVLGEKSIANEFKKRAQNYRNVYNPVSSFMQPRTATGQFQPDFHPDIYTPHICESNAWHYFWSVQHDIDGLIKLVGKKRFSEKLDSMFNHNPIDSEGLPIFSTGMIGQYAHGNEPSHHVAFLYNYIGQPEKSQQLVSRIRKEFYRNEPAGLCGNEDCGQMSAWYVFAAMGFYPVDPSGGNYDVVSPLFPEVRIHFNGGKDFVVKAPGGDRIVSRLRLNGKRYNSWTLRHADLIKGGMLVME